VVSKQILILIYKSFTFAHIEQFCSELSLKNLTLLEKEIPECQTFMAIKKT